MMLAVNPVESPSERNRSIAFGVFVLLLAVYTLTYSGRIHVVDEFYMLAVTESLSKGRLSVNQIASLQWGFEPIEQVGAFGPSGDVFCKKGIGTSLVGLPLFASARLWPALGAVHAALLTNAVVTALTGSVLFLHLVLTGLGRRASLVCALLFGFGTLAWPYTRTFFAEPLAALGLLVAIRGCSAFRRTRRWTAALLSGLGSGIALSAVLPSIVTLPPLALGLAVSAATGVGGSRWANLLKAVAGWFSGLAGPAMVTFLYNLLRFSSPWTTGWALSAQDFSFPILRGLLGLFLSPAKGLALYVPIAILALPGCLLGLRRRRYDSLLILVVLAAFAVVYAKWIRWDAGWAWGTRYLVPILPLMMILVAEVWESVDRRRSISGYVLLSPLVVLTIAVQLVGVAGNFVEVEFALREMYSLPPDGWYHLGRRALLDITMSPLTLMARHAWQGEWDVSWLSQGYPDGLALGAASLGVAAGAVVLWAAWASHRRYRLVVGVVSALLIATTATVLVRATDRPYYNVEVDGRLEALSYILSHRRPNDGVISVVPYLHELILDRYSDLPPVYGLPRAQDGRPQTLHLLDSAIARHERLWFLSVWTFPGDAENRTEHRLAEEAFLLETWESGGYRVSLLTSPASPDLEVLPGVVFGDEIRLERLTLSRVGEAPAILQASLDWRALCAAQHDYQVFLHVYDSSGNRVGQADHTPVGGFRSTSSWGDGELVRDRIAIQLTDGEGGYRLALGLYDWRTGKRATASAGSEAVVVIDDAVWLSQEAWDE
jgi:hypothetical protein